MLFKGICLSLLSLLVFGPQIKADDVIKVSFCSASVTETRACMCGDNCPCQPGLTCSSMDCDKNKNPKLSFVAKPLKKMWRLVCDGFQCRKVEVVECSSYAEFYKLIESGKTGTFFIGVVPAGELKTEIFYHQDNLKDFDAGVYFCFVEGTTAKMKK